MIIGSPIGGYMGDKYGRRMTLIIGITIQLIFGYLQALSYSVYQYAFHGIITNIGIGFVVAASPPILYEVLLKNRSAQAQILYNMFITLGEVFTSVVAYYTLDSMNSGNWRLLVAITNSASFIGLIAVLYLDESYVCKLEKHKYEEAFQLIDKAILTNDSQAQPLTDDEK